MKIKDIIYREDAIKALHEEWDGGWMEVTGEWVADNCEAVLNRLPSADGPQGEWIAVSAFDAVGGDEATWMAHGNPTAFHYCSECKEQTRIDEFGEEILSNYCPNCGCRMKGADDESG